MAYDDGYYYGQCKLVAVVDDAADNDKTVLITTDDNKTYSGTIVNKKCEFLLPPRTLYTVQKVSSGSAEFTTKVEAGYGDCILVHLDTGYVEVKQGDIVGLDYIKAATDDNLKNKVPEAKAVKELNSSLNKIFSYDHLITEVITTVGENRTLLHPITDYDFIWINFGVTSDSGVLSVSNIFVPVYTFLNNNYGQFLYSVGGNIDTRIAVTFVDKNTIKIALRGGYEFITAIIGYKFGI